jgi:acyl-CoA thioesterase
MPDTDERTKDSQENQVSKVTPHSTVDYYWVRPQQPPKGNEMKSRYIAALAVTQSNFLEASKDFHDKRGHGDTWERLDEAMWALQAVQNEEYLGSLDQLSVDQWVAHLAGRHKSAAHA